MTNELLFFDICIARANGKGYTPKSHEKFASIGEDWTLLGERTWKSYFKKAPISDDSEWVYVMMISGVMGSGRNDELFGEMKRITPCYEILDRDIRPRWRQYKFYAKADNEIGIEDCADRGVRNDAIRAAIESVYGDRHIVWGYDYEVQAIIYDIGQFRHAAEVLNYHHFLIEFMTADALATAHKGLAIYVSTHSMPRM